MLLKDLAIGDYFQFTSDRKAFKLHRIALHTAPIYYKSNPHYFMQINNTFELDCDSFNNLEVVKVKVYARVTKEI